MNELQVLTHNEQRVLTTQQLAEIYETDAENIQKNFQRNKVRFTENKHYHILKGADLKAFKNEPTNSPLVGKNASQLILWTEKGADRHCKILDTDKAWEQFDNLEETYFRIKDHLQLPQTYIDALRQLVDSEEKKQQLVIENKILKPKADYCDLILQSKSLVAISQIAKDYGMSANEMNKILHELHIQYKQNGQWLLYRRYDDKGYVHSETFNFKHVNGIADVKMLTKWTQRGRLFLYDALKENGIIPVIEKAVTNTSSKLNANKKSTCS